MKSTTSFTSYIKLGMIPLLGFVFYSVLPSRKNQNAGVNDAKTTEVSQRSSKTKGAILDDSNKITWPDFSTEDLQGSNPFDRRRVFPEPIQINSENPGSGLLVNLGLVSPPKESLAVQAVYQTPQGVAALVGGRVVHIGDRFEDGREVVGITTTEIQIAMPKVD